MTAIDGSAAWTYTYDTDGLRLSRSDGTTTYNYVYLGGQLKRMTVGNTEIYFAYDSDGSPMSMVYNGITYYYVKNLQGDVVGIVDKTGVQVVAYSYDAWGNLLGISGTKASTIGAKNPLRYRGYVYDTETSLYYLQSRYYNPEIGRFINADALVSTGGLLGNNMFAYCKNNTICYSDPTGYDESGQMQSSRRELFFAMALGIGLVSVYISPAKKKPPNLPSSKKMNINIDHVVSGHTPDGDRNPDGKKSIFWGLTVQQISKAIYEAYGTASKLQTQGERLKLTGYSSTFNLTIEMWINIVTYIIETAYPK